MLNKIRLTSEDNSLLIRKIAIKLTKEKGMSHIGSILSVAELLSVVLIDFLRIIDNKGKYDFGDFILSKGHAGLAYYISLFNAGLISEELLLSYSDNNSPLTGHLTKNQVECILISTGSLGHGFPIAVGKAFARKLDKNDKSVFVIISDGECNIGTTWESALISSRFSLDNLILIVDYNKLQSLTSTELTLGIEPIKSKFESFGFQTLEINGHDVNEIRNTLNILANEKNNKPKVVIAHTTKGKGISFMENDIKYHYKPLNDCEFEIANLELNNEK